MLPPQTPSVVVQIQGTHVKFSSALEPLNDFARTHFTDREREKTTVDGSIDEKTAVESHLEWIEGIAPKKKYDKVPSNKTRLDRDIDLGSNDLAWSRIDDFSDLRLQFHLKNDRLILHGQHFFSLSPSPLKDRLKKGWYSRRLPKLREKRFSTLLYYMVYYPSFWLLRRRGLFPLHAAALKLKGTGLVLCGLPGCGKTTLSLALLALPDAHLLSDNIIFFDNKNVYQCPEPVLLDHRTLDLIGPAGSSLLPVGRGHVFDRSWYHVSPDRLVNQTAPRLFFFVVLGEGTSLRRLSRQEAFQRFKSANLIAQEIRRYLIYSSVLGFFGSNGASPSYGEDQALQSLLRLGPCYELTVGWDDGLHKALDQVCTLMDTVRS